MENTNLEIKRDFSLWMRNTADAAGRHLNDGEYYGGKDGHMRFAKACGIAVHDFGEYGIKSIGSTYGAVYVIACGLKPILNAKEWIDGIWQGIREAETIDEIERELREGIKA